MGSAFTELYLWWFVEPVGAFVLLFGLMLVGGAVIGALSL